MARKYSSTAVATTLSGTITNSATAMTVASVTGWPTSYPYTIIIDGDTASEEVCTVTAAVSTALTVVRGADSTTAVTHTAGATVRHGVSARDFSEPQVHIDATTSVHGITDTSVLATLAGTQTLSNKTLTTPIIASISNGGTVSLPTSTDTLVARNTTETLTNKTLTAPKFSTIVNGAATLTRPTTTDTMVGRATTDTLTGKTLTAPVIATISNTGTLTLPTSTDTLVGRATTDTLTNKTLTAPVISTITNTGTVTLPSSTDTLVGRATTDTLTNKTINGAVIDGATTLGGQTGTVIAAAAAKAPYAMAAGTATINLSAASSGSTSPTISYPASRFSVAPIVQVTKVDTSGQAITLVPMVTSNSSTGMTITLYSTTGATLTVACTVHWTAIQMASGSASG